MSKIEQELSEGGRAMSDDNLEVLDANIVILPEKPLTPIVNVLSLFEGGKLASFMRKPLSPSQGLSLDVAQSAAVGTFQIESMRSQKTISISQVRIEVHDRSGEPDLERARIPETMDALANALHVKRTKAIGANWEVVIKLPEGLIASAIIAEKLLRQNMSFLPQNMKLL